MYAPEKLAERKLLLLWQRKFLEDNVVQIYRVRLIFVEIKTI